MEKKKYKSRIDREEWIKTARKLPWLLIIPAGYGLALLAAKYPSITEKYFSEGIFPYISMYLGKASSFAGGVSVAELLICSAIIIVTLLVLIHIVGLFIGKIRFARFVGFLLSLCIAAGILFNLFYFDWGFNYSRPSLYTRMELDVEPRPVEELEALCRDLAGQAAQLRQEVDEDENGVFTLPGGYRAYFNQIPQAYQNLGEQEAIFSHRVYPAKGVIASVGMSYAGISGIFIPFTAEANVNVDQPPLLLLSSAAHETAHYLGIAREDEANFVGYLACIHSDIPAIEYSGVMLALINCMNKLYAADQELYFGVRALYSDGMQRDLVNYSEYWATFEGPVEEKVSEINDNYLKFNQQDEGVKSYGMMVDLLLAYYAEG
jgi:hypothetical protein